MSENKIFSYTRRDYEGSRKEGIAKIPILSKGQWTDLNATDPGIIILDYVHALADMIQYYQDHQAMEAFLTTAKERANIFRLAKQLSYQVRSAKGAVCNVTFSSPDTYSRPIKIPKHTAVRTISQIQYLTMEDAYLPTGSQSIVVPCMQGEIISRSYTGTGISRFSALEGATNQYFYLSAPNIDTDSIVIVDNAGRTWTNVEYIVFSGPNDRVYQIELLPDDTIKISFGDGERGVVPQPTDTFNITCLSTAGEAGRVGANELSKIATPVYDENNQYIEFLVNNNQASSGGSSSQTSSEIKELAPGSIKAQDRAVTLSDFENLAKLVDGVEDAKAYDINTKPELCLYHEVKVLIIPDNPEGSIEILKDKVYNYLYQRMIPPTNLQVLTPTLTPINVQVIVKKMDNEDSDRLEYLIRQSILEYFDSRTGSIGEAFYPSDLSGILVSLEGVRYVSSVTPNEPVSIGDLSIATLGDLTIQII